MSETRAPLAFIKPFGTLSCGTVVDKILLRNSNGMRAELMTYGASLISLTRPGGKSAAIELTLGFDTLEEYVAHPFYFGCTIGRVANRITGCRFNYEDSHVQLTCNENAFSHLHGGLKGFDKVVWRTQLLQSDDGSGVKFSYFSPDGEENYRGNLSVSVTYFLTHTNELKILYHATTDAATPLNLTNHTYWNLDGAGSGTVLDHRVQLHAEQYLETNANSLPTGQIHPVALTEFDLRTPVLLRDRWPDKSGFDHYFVLPLAEPKLRPAARVVNSTNTCALEVLTTETGLQFYTGTYLEDYLISGNRHTRRWGGFCLETQGYPDAVNHSHFPCIMLLPGDVYHQETVYRLEF
jgi:aldose 1-epimerase